MVVASILSFGKLLTARKNKANQRVIGLLLDSDICSMEQKSWAAHQTSSYLGGPSRPSRGTFRPHSPTAQ